MGNRAFGLDQPGSFPLYQLPIYEKHFSRTGRNFIGIERDAAHYKTACDRIAHELDGALL